MPRDQDIESTEERHSPLEMSPEAFREAGYQVVDDLAAFLGSVRERKVTGAQGGVAELKAVVGNGPLPSDGMESRALLREVSDWMIRYSLFNGHPRFWGYVTSSAAPIGALGDLLAAGINPNVGAWQLSPLATEIEVQTIRWIAEFVGYPIDCGGIMVSGGNMANLIGFLAGSRARASWDLRKEGLQGARGRLCCYCSEASHTWVQKAADLSGLGTDAIHWIPCDEQQRMDLAKLREQIEADRREGITPVMVIAAAGSVGTGSVDPIEALADLCGREGLWLHVDGAYGAMAAALSETGADLKALRHADSVALDPHKWLYSPLEAGCVLVRDPRVLSDTFSFHPDYYKFEGGDGERPTNFFELGLQNSRGFRALKVWLAFRQVGRNAFVEMIRQDIRLAQAMWSAVSADPELEAFTCNLSITTFRYVPPGLSLPAPERQTYLNALNEAVLERLQKDGEVFLSNAVLKGDFVLRACIVNFRTTLRDVQQLPALVVRIGRELDATLRRELAVSPPNPPTAVEVPPGAPAADASPILP